MTVGGSIQSVSIKGREFHVAADADSNQKLGGFENEGSPNGDGSMRTIKSRVLWQRDGLSLEVNPDKGDQEFLQDIADSPENVSITITGADNVTWEGKGTIIGEVSVSSQNATAPITLQGPGKLRQQ